jgi:phage gp29-like protein
MKGGLSTRIIEAAGAAAAMLRRRKGNQPAMPAMVPSNLQQIIQPTAYGNWVYAISSGYTPQYIESILRLGQFGDTFQVWQLFHLMEDTWPRLCKNLLELKRAVAASDWQVQPYAEEGAEPTPEAVKRAAVVKAALFGMRPDPGADAAGFQQMIIDLLDAWAKSVSVMELDWEVRANAAAGSYLGLKQARWIHPMNYGFDFEAGAYALRRGGPDMSSAVSPDRSDAFTPFPPDKFAVSICKARSGLPTGAALLRPLAFWWAASNFSAGWLLNFAQIFGQPIRWGTYDASNPSLLPLLQAALANMGSTAWAALPAGTQLELKETVSGAADNPQFAVHELADRLCDLLVLGQTLTSEQGSKGGGSKALGMVHKDVRDEIIQAAAEHAETVVNDQIIPSILRVNFGDEEQAPRLERVTWDESEAMVRAQRDQVLLTSGIPLPKSWLYRRHGVPEPQGDGPTISGPAAGPRPGQPGADAPGQGAGEPKDGKPQLAAARAAAIRAARSHPIFAMAAQDRLMDRMLEDISGIEAKWLQGAKPWLKELILAAENPALSDEQFAALLEAKRDKVPEELAPLLKPEAVARALEAYMGAACVNGALSGAAKRPLPAKGAA